MKKDGKASRKGKMTLEKKELVALINSDHTIAIGVPGALHIPKCRITVGMNLEILKEALKNYESMTANETGYIKFYGSNYPLAFTDDPNAEIAIMVAPRIPDDGRRGRRVDE